MDVMSCQIWKQNRVYVPKALNPNPSLRRTWERALFLRASAGDVRSKRVVFGELKPWCARRKFRD